MKSFCCFIFLIYSSFYCFCQSKQKITLVIHGGAGTIEKGAMSPELEEQYLDHLKIALNTGYKILDEGGTSLEAVVAAIVFLENSPLFNAGKGAVFTHNKKNELDASIMDGASGMAGAVAGVTSLKNPIVCALEVLKNSPHVMLSGRGAEDFAKERGLEMVEPGYFFDQRRLEQLQRIQKKETDTRKIEKGNNNIQPDNQRNNHFNQLEDAKFGTVGAVALDMYGNIAAGTSTGGMANKKYGRIGDSPIIGAGTYADNETCAVSATGSGEFFIRNVVAYDIAALMKYRGLKLKEATEHVIMEKLVAKGGDGGVISLDKEGNIAMTFNTSGMYRGFIKHKNAPEAFIFKDKDKD